MALFHMFAMLCIAVQAQQNTTNIIELVDSIPELSTLGYTLTLNAFASVANLLADESQNYTLFAPTNDAFAALGAYENDNETLALLNYHILEGSVTRNALTSDLYQSNFFLTELNQFMHVRAREADVHIFYNANLDFAVIGTQHFASNGVIHVIDAVVIPPGAPSSVLAEHGNLDGLVQALADTALTETVDGLEESTIFAPVDPSFDGLTADSDSLQLHVVPQIVHFVHDYVRELVTINGDILRIELDENDNLFVNGVRVQQTDILTSSGVIHILEGVLEPFTTTTGTTTTGTTTTTDTTVQSDLNIFDTMRDITELDQLEITLLRTEFASVRERLSDETQNWTLFAPNNDALSAVDPEGLDVLNILLYHVVQGTITRANLAGEDITRQSQFFETETGSFMHVYNRDQHDDPHIFFNANQEYANVITGQIFCTNGVIHMVDRLVIPPGPPSSVFRDIGQLAGLITALDDNALMETIDNLTESTVFAPIDPAFDHLLGSSNLSTLLPLHVVPRMVHFIHDFLRELETISGDTLTIDIDENDQFTVNGIRMVQQDILTSTGVIHTIQSVIGAEAAPTTSPIITTTTADGGDGDTTSHATALIIGIGAGVLVLACVGYYVYSNNKSNSRQEPLLDGYSALPATHATN